jgi:response regulator of citrate/malate metabolism
MERIEVPAEWRWEELRLETARVLDPGPGFYTAEEWAERWGVSRATALRRLKCCQDSGRLEIARKTTWRMGGAPYPTPAYRIV